MPGRLRRVARGPVVILTIDAEVCADMWLLRDYLPEAAALDRATFPALAPPGRVARRNSRGGDDPHGTNAPDWTLASFWAHPERVLDETARNATSGFARMDPAVVKRVASEVDKDLRSGTWDRRYGRLRNVNELDVENAARRCSPVAPRAQRSGS